MFFRTGVIFIGIYIDRKTSALESLFNEVAGLTTFHFISASSQKRLQHTSFPANIAKFLGTGFLIEYL